MLTDEEIRMAWRLILGREPENERVYEAHRTHESLESLRRVLLQSAEFRQKFAGTVKTIDRLRLAVNPTSPAKASAEQLKMMFDRIQEQWTALGESEPYWSVLTNPRFKMEKIEENKKDFFQSGARDLQAVRAAISRNRLQIPEGATCVELGCGVGRVSLQLASIFSNVHAYDISEGNLAIAKRYAEQTSTQNVHFHLMRNIADYDLIEEFDLFYSIIVLQHNPPPVQRYMLEKIVARGKPGCIFIFQVPTYAARYHFEPEEYLEAPPRTLEMHVLPFGEISDVLTAGQCRLLEVMEDNAAGHPEWLSQTFVAQKRGERIVGAKQRGARPSTRRN